MNKILFTLLTALLVLLTSCSIEPVDPITSEFFEGEYRLTEYVVDLPVDLNNDSNYSTNLLEEIDCENRETLVFDKQGFVYSNQTFNPKIDLLLVDASLGTYSVDVECDTEGIIGTASAYTKSGNQIMINERKATISGTKITMLFKNALKIYNQNKTLVLGTKDLTLIYTKK